MDSSSSPSAVPRPPKTGGEEEAKTVYDACREQVAILSTGKTLFFPLYKHPRHNYYFSMDRMVNALVVEKCFVARPSDVIIASFPKSGTTWTMALLYATINRHDYMHSSNNPLTNFSPHDAILNLEAEVYHDDKIPDLSGIPSPRLFSTHIPYPSLPESIVQSQCKLIYIWRDPKDVFVSFYNYIEKNLQQKISHTAFEKTFDMFCEGYSFAGPFWDHVLGYWRASLNNKNLLFLKYEDMKVDTKTPLKKLGELVGKPFSDGEEKQGVLDDIIKLCSLDSLKKMEVNKTGRTKDGLAHNSTFYRKGNVGDWANYFTPEMKERVDMITKEKFSGSELLF